MNTGSYPYRVSVSIITYNQADYIGEAIDSAIAQKVNFPYEIIIGDDYSTDGTRVILLEYKQRYPELIKLNLHEQRGEGIAGRLNNITNIRSAQGKYIAFLDGDDFWISKDKLQRQADFMDSHPNYAFCCHNAWEIKNDRYNKILSLKFHPFRNDNSFSLADIAARTFHIPSASLFIRSRHLQDLPAWFWEVYTADVALQLIAAQHGQAKYFKDILAGYRFHTSNVSKEYFYGENYLNVLQNDRRIYHQYFPITKENLLDFHAEYYLNESTYLFNRKMFGTSFVYLLKSMYYDKRSFYRFMLKIRSRIRQKLISVAPPSAEDGDEARGQNR